MAFIQPDSEDQRASNLSLSLSSNNPFRNRAGSPLPTSPTSPFDDPNPNPTSRPVSNNPFLEPSHRTSSPQSRSLPNNDNMAAKEGNLVDLLGDLNVDEKKSAPPRPPPMNSNARGPPRGENNPPGGRRGPPPGHRPTRSQEEALRARRQRPNGPSDPTSPPRRAPGSRPMRRNSEGSLAEEKPLTEEEKRARDQRRREREIRHREKRGDKTKPANKKMDIIDRLDATSIYGTGMFHHDGPFDAANPHRNKVGVRRAPMQAFAKDSLNMSMGGSGPLNARPDHATFMGNGTEEAFTDYATGVDKPVPINKNTPVFDPLARGPIIHGEETEGLGTSTFLEGTPAARSAVQRYEQESALGPDGGLQRKKSLAQRFRGINRQPRGGFNASGRMTNPEGAYREHGSSASMSSARDERNPFFNEYDSKKGGEQISVARKMSYGQNGPSSPPVGLERRATSDSLGESESAPAPKIKSGGGLLSRVKSLKGGPRSRPADRDYPPAPAAA